MAKGCAMVSLNTPALGLHHYILLCSGVDFRCVLVGWQDKRPVRDTGGAEGKRTHRTSQTRNASSGQDRVASVAIPQECK